MAAEDDKLDKLLDEMKKNLKKKNVAATIHRSDDIKIASHTPHTIPTGLAELDLQLGGRGGLPAGRLIEYYGFEMCGKTTAALHAIAEVQKMGGFAAFIDAEHTFSPLRAEQCGVNLERLQIMSAHSIESIFEAAYAYVEYIENLGLATKYPVLLVVDSVTGTHIESELKQNMDKEAYSKDIRIGGEAKAIRRGVKRLHGILARSKVSAILINHAIAANLTAAFGKKKAAAGGHGTKIMASVRIEFNNVGKLYHFKNKEEVRDGQKISLTIEKLKNAQLTKVKVKEVHLKKQGFDQCLSLLNAAVMTGWIMQQGKDDSKYFEMPWGEDTKQFKQNEWPDVVRELGGYHTVYAMWLDRAKQSGHIQLWEESW